MTPLSTVLSKKVSHGKPQASAVVMRNRTQCHLRVRVCIISPSCHFQHDYDNNARQWANFVDKIRHTQILNVCGSKSKNHGYQNAHLRFITHYVCL